MYPSFLRSLSLLKPISVWLFQCGQHSEKGPSDLALGANVRKSGHPAERDGYDNSDRGCSDVHQSSRVRWPSEFREYHPEEGPGYIAHVELWKTCRHVYLCVLLYIVISWFCFGVLNSPSIYLGFRVEFFMLAHFIVYYWWDIPVQLHINESVECLVTVSITTCDKVLILCVIYSRF